MSHRPIRRLCLLLLLLSYSLPLGAVRRTIHLSDYGLRAQGSGRVVTSSPYLRLFPSLRLPLEERTKHDSSTLRRTTLPSTGTRLEYDKRQEPQLGRPPAVALVHNWVKDDLLTPVV